MAKKNNRWVDASCDGHLEFAKVRHARSPSPTPAEATLSLNPTLSLSHNPSSIPSPNTNTMHPHPDQVWKLPHAEIVISVTDGAQALTLPPALQEAFNYGLVSAATSANAWVITGGTDTGVMHLVGKAIFDAGLHGKVPDPPNTPLTHSLLTVLLLTRYRLARHSLTYS